MSKKRSITKKINLQLDFPLPDTNTLASRYSVKVDDTCIQDSYFGENLKSVNEFSEQSPVVCESVSEDEDFYSVDWSKSSASSTSGSDNLETECTQKLLHEYKKLERTLYNEQTASTSSDENEIKQWKTSFPHLRISGHAVNIPCFVECNTNSYYEEVIAEHCDSFTEIVDDPHTAIKNYIKETVIDNVVKEVQRKHSKASPVPSLYNRELIKVTEDIVTSCDCSAALHNNDTKYVPYSASEPLLQVSSMPLHNSPMPFPKFEYQSPLMRSHISAAKWQRENSITDYASLPQIANSNVVPCSTTSGISKKQRQTSANKNNRYSANIRQKSSTSVAKPNTKFITASSSPRTKNVTLPPIQNLNLSVDGEKSVSSTPRKFISRPVSQKLAHLADNKLFYNNFKYLDK